MKRRDAPPTAGRAAAGPVAAGAERSVLLLELRDASVAFGAVRAVRTATLAVRAEAFARSTRSSTTLPPPPEANPISGWPGRTVTSSFCPGFVLAPPTVAALPLPVSPWPYFPAPVPVTVTVYSLPLARCHSGFGVPLANDLVDRQHHLVLAQADDEGTSLRHDLLIGHRMELESLQGALIRLGRETGIATPWTEAAYAILEPWAIRNENLARVAEHDLSRV